MELLWIWLLLAAAEARREYLLDTTRMDNLDWTTFTQHSGWREASFTSSSGTGESQTFRVYAVCEVAQEDVNNWLRTPYISRKHANRIYIETKFTMRECTRHPNPNHLQQCKEKFNLLYYEADSNFANAMMPTWDTMSYRHIDAIAADREFSDINNAAINTKTRDISVTLNGLYFAYQDTGACTSLISVKVYYVLCDAITIKFARFEKTVTGPELTSIVQQTGQCVENAEEESKPTYLCRADGTWYLNDGGCQCKAGYQPDKSVMGGACMECKPGTYKWQIGGERCEACPDKSFTHHRKSTECKCLKGYYRDNNDLASVPCAKPPSAPRNISGRFVDQNMAILQWLGPERDGGRKDIYYSVECRGCSNQVRFTPNKDRLTQTRVTLSDLKPSTTYKVTVYSRNGVSKASQTAWDFYQTIDFTTEASVPSKVMNVHIIERGPNYIVLGWEKPRDANKIEKYEIKYFSTNEASNMSAVQTTALNYAFRDLKMLSKFGFQVRAKTSRGWGKYSKTFYTSTSPRTIMSRDKGYGGYGQEPNNRISSKVKEEGNPVGIIVGAIVAVSVCMIIIIVIFFIILRRNNTACSEKSPADNNMPYGNMQCGMYADYAGSNIMSLNGMMTLPLYHQAGTIRTYVDPHTYEDPTQAVREFTKEIDASHITIETVIGGGEFGDVCKGKLRMPSQSEKSVAIKTLKPGATDQNRLDFLTEASIMGQFEDPNVIYLGGVVTKSHPIMIVTEYMANGSLDTFLRNNDGQFTVLQLTHMLRGIAAGMKYLSECGYVHRDLAARNILVNENLVCKVADFGLSRVIEADTIDGAYTTKGGKIPVRWTAPEAIAYRKFTSSSDVWSYGVVMWEVISYGERPYWNWSNQDVIKAVDNGFRLPPPMDCPDAVFQLMLDCWQKERGHRPKFALLVLALDKLIQAPELLLRLAQYRQPDIQNCSFEAPIPDFAHCATVEEWLTLIKMDRYIDTFHTMGYISIDEVLKLNSKDLLSMGINLIGHQRKILNSIQCLNHQMNGTVVNYDPLSDCAYSVGRLPVTDLFV